MKLPLQPQDVGVDVGWQEGGGGELDAVGRVAGTVRQGAEGRPARSGLASGKSAAARGPALELVADGGELGQAVRGLGEAGGALEDTGGDAGTAAQGDGGGRGRQRGDDGRRRGGRLPARRRRPRRRGRTRLGGGGPGRDWHARDARRTLGRPGTTPLAGGGRSRPSQAPRPRRRPSRVELAGGSGELLKGIIVRSGV